LGENRYDTDNPLVIHHSGFGPSPLAPRLDTLAGKTVYMVDIGFGGGYTFLEEAAAWLYRNIPSIKIELRHKRGNMFLDDPELWAEVKAKGNAVILGVGG
jgi:hypothetical protein